MQRFTPAVFGRLLLSIGWPKAALPLTAQVRKLGREGLLSAKVDVQHSQQIASERTLGRFRAVGRIAFATY